MPQIRGVGNFSADVTKFCKRTKLKADVVVRKVCLDLYAGLIRTTPVDTGRARASWNIATNRVDLSSEPERTKKGSSKQKQSATQAAQMMSLTAKYGDTVYISNNLPYITSLNRGTSKQAPPGFVQGEIVRVIGHFHWIVQSAGYND